MDKRNQVLVIGHPLIVNSNRKFWSIFANMNGVTVDLITPKEWSSNLVGKLRCAYDESSDSGLRQIFPVKCVNKGNGSLFFFSPAPFFKILNSRKYDFIILNQEGWSIALFFINFLLFFSCNKKTQLFITANQNIKKIRWSWMHRYERWNARKVKGILYCSEEVRDVLEWKQLKCKYVYFPFSFDGDLYKRYLDYNQNNTEIIRFGYLGRLSEEKGIGTLLQALDILAIQDEFKFKLFIAGAGPLETELRKKNYTEFLGVITHARGYLFYEKIDIFILPSETRPFWKEQFGRVLVEAAAAGNLVVGSDSGAIPEVLGKLEMPYVFKQQNVASLVEQLEQAVQVVNTKAGSRLTDNSQQKSFTQFSHQSVACYLYKQIQKMMI